MLRQRKGSGHPDLNQNRMQAKFISANGGAIGSSCSQDNPFTPPFIPKLWAHTVSLVANYGPRHGNSALAGILQHMP